MEKRKIKTLNGNNNNNNETNISYTKHKLMQIFSSLNFSPLCPSLPILLTPSPFLSSLPTPEAKKLTFVQKLFFWNRQKTHTWSKSIKGTLVLLCTSVDLSDVGF